VAGRGRARRDLTILLKPKIGHRIEAFSGLAFAKDGALP
jgi:hypothetical protein